MLSWYGLVISAAKWLMPTRRCTTQKLASVSELNGSIFQKQRSAPSLTKQSDFEPITWKSILTTNIDPGAKPKLLWWWRWIVQEIDFTVDFHQICFYQASFPFTILEISLKYDVVILDPLGFPPYGGLYPNNFINSFSSVLPNAPVSSQQSMSTPASVGTSTPPEQMVLNLMRTTSMNLPDAPMNFHLSKGLEDGLLKTVTPPLPQLPLPTPQIPIPFIPSMTISSLSSINSSNISTSPLAFSADSLIQPSPSKIPPPSISSEMDFLKPFYLSLHANLENSPSGNVEDVEEAKLLWFKYLTAAAAVFSNFRGGGQEEALSLQKTLEQHPGALNLNKVAEEAHSRDVQWCIIFLLTVNFVFDWSNANKTDIPSICSFKPSPFWDRTRSRLFWAIYLIICYFNYIVNTRDGNTGHCYMKGTAGHLSKYYSSNPSLDRTVGKCVQQMLHIKLSVFLTFFGAFVSPQSDLYCPEKQMNVSSISM